MNEEQHERLFQCRSLSELLKQPACNEEHAAIWIARDAHGTLAPRSVLSQFDALAQGFPARDVQRLAPNGQAGSLIRYLTQRQGFKANQKNYHDPENSYIDSVLRRRTGIPISLALVYLAIARRVEIPAYGVSFPGHFLVHVGAGAGVFLDPFAGKVLTASDLPGLLTRFLGAGNELKHEYLAQATPQQFAQRMLLNLKRVHETQHSYARAMLICDRLLEIAPTPELRRDRGLYALEVGAYKVAAADLAHYLLKRPSADDAKQVRAFLARSRTSSAPLN